MIEALKKFSAATNNEFFDAEYNGGEWMIDAVETHETIDQFIESSAKWNESSSVVFGEIAGFKFAAWKKMQAVKNQPRHALSIIDFGEIRFALDVDLSML